jgi:tRNA threonylcarbamoyladenosine biosynthesis protein TsaB
VKLLAIETTTEACSAALYLNGEQISRYELAPRRHAELILPMCEELLNDANIIVTDLDAIAFGRGPGAFTGVRIAAGVVQGMAWAADIPVVAVSSLAAIALSAVKQHACDNVAVAVDARMNEVYWGCYQRSDRAVSLLGDEAVLPPEHAMLPDGKWFAAGSGWQTYSEKTSDRLSDRIIASDTEILPHAAMLAELAVIACERGEQLSAEQVVPVYLRDNVAKKRKQL